MMPLAYISAVWYSVRVIILCGKSQYFRALLDRTCSSTVGVFGGHKKEPIGQFINILLNICNSSVHYSVSV